MKIDLDDLARKAKAAAPGPWTAPDCITTDATNGRVATEDDLQVADAYDNTSWSEAICLANAQHIAANSPPVTLALIARIRELEAAADRVVTIADEAFGLGPVEPVDATLTRIELGIFKLRLRAEASR